MAATTSATKKTRKARKLYPLKKRIAILAEASANGLTGKDVAKKYGISMMTYYNWRKKEGAAGKQVKRTRAVAPASGNGSTGEMRKIIKQRVRLVAPSILRDEVMAYLAESLGSRNGRRRKHR